MLGLGAAAILAGVAAQVTLTVRNSNLAPAEPGTTGHLHSAQVISGMCIETLEKSAGTVNVVPCDQRHAAAVVSTYTFPGDEWPGDEVAANSVLDYCATQLAPGGPLARAVADRDWVAWVPSAETWQHGDRSGLCIVTSEIPWTGDAMTPTEEQTLATT
jgi:hypothetical protein